MPRFGHGLCIGWAALTLKKSACYSRLVSRDTLYSPFFLSEPPIGGVRAVRMATVCVLA